MMSEGYAQHGSTLTCVSRAKERIKTFPAHSLGFSTAVKWQESVLAEETGNGLLVGFAGFSPTFPFSEVRMQPLQTLLSSVECSPRGIDR